MKKDYYTLTGISKMLNLPVSTVRYWKENFLAWLPHQGEGRKMRYHTDSIDIFRFIQQCFGKGMRSDDIKDELSDRYPIQHDVVKPYEQSDITPSPPDNTPALNNMSALQLMIESIMDKGVGKLTEAIASVQELRDENRELKERLAKLETIVFEKQQLNNDNTTKTKSANLDKLRDRIQKMRDDKVSWAKIADALNADGLKNPKTGGAWNRKSVQKVVQG